MSGLSESERVALMDACPLQITPAIEDHAALFAVVERILADRSPAVEEVRTEWGMRRALGDVGTVLNCEGSRKMAERNADVFGGELVRREVRYGQWVEVPE